MVAAALGCGAAFVVAIEPAVAGADPLSQTFTTPGAFMLTAPPYAVRATFTVQGASGTDGSASAFGANQGGTGGLGTVITAQVDVVGGESLGGFIGAAGAELPGAAGDGTGGRGGTGGQFTLFGGSGANLNVPAFDVVAQGGGGGGGGGGAFFGQAGGNGGEGQFGFPTDGNGAAGSGVGGGAGGRHDPIASNCVAETYVGPPAPAAPGSDAGGAGSSGGGFCPGQGSSGGTGGGGGGGGAAGNGEIANVQEPNITLAAAPGDGFVRIDFTEGPTAPQITSAGSLSVMSSVGTVRFVVTGTGLPAPTFSLSGAPSWLTIDPVTGIVSGAIPPGLVGTFTFTVHAADGTPPDASQQFTLTLTASPVTLVAPGTLSGNVSNPFSATLAARGGIAPYTWSASGTLPPGLRLGPGGQITGTPTQTGTFTFTATASDSEQPTAASVSEPVTITIAPRQLTVTTPALANAKIGTSYSQTLRAAMGIAPLAWRVKSGSLPQGLTLNAHTGVITGVPTQLGSFAFTVKVTDATKPTAMTAAASFTIRVGPTIQAAVYATDGGYSAVQSFPLGSSGNTLPTTSITGAATGLNGTTAAVIDPVSGTLYIASAGNDTIAEYPYGATGNVAPTSVIAGPASGLGYPLALALDGSGRLYVANLAGSITVYAPGAEGDAEPAATISGANTGLVSPSGLAFDRAGNLWVADLGTDRLTEFPAGASGDVKPAATIGGSSSGLNGPHGMTLDNAGNLLVANPGGDTLTEYAPGEDPDATPLRTISGLALPDGVDVDAQGNIYVANGLTGVSEYGPDAAGAATPIATISGQATGISGPTDVAVAPPLVIRTRTLAGAHAGRSYHARLRANLGTTPYRWKVIRGTLPRGIRLHRDGTLSGRPSTRGTYRFTVRVRDSSLPTMTATCRLVLVVGKSR